MSTAFLFCWTEKEKKVEKEEKDRFKVQIIYHF